MQFRKFLVSSSTIVILSLSASASGFAKEKAGQSPSGTPQSSDVASDNLGASVLADAIRFCDLLVTDDPSTIDVLKSEGWSTELDRNTGNYKYYKELSADYEYSGVGFASIWGFIEDYPEVSIGYCSFTISNPEIRFSISAINEIDHMTGDITTEGQEVYGAWHDISSQPSIFIHAYHNSDTFAYQINRINKLN